MLDPQGNEPKIQSPFYEQELIKSFTDYLSLLKTLNVEPPIFIFLTLLGVKGFSLALKRGHYDNEGYKIDREILPLPEVVIDNYDVSAEKVLQPCFDSIWNACGFPRDLYYDDKGEWHPK